MNPKSHVATVFAAVLLASLFAVPAAATTPSVNASGGSAAPGETVTVSIDIQDAGTVKLSGLPGNWTVANRTDDGAFTSSGDTYVGWVWGGNQSSRSVSVTFDVPSDAQTGEYTFDVTAEDYGGNTATTTTTVSIGSSDTTAPTADAGPNRTASVGSSVSLDGSASSDDTGITSYEWDVDGDGTVDMIGAQASTTYSDPGTYTATLTVTDGAGNSDTDSTTVTVQDTTAPTASVGQDVIADVGQSVGFDGFGSNDNVGVDSYSWDFGDGTTATGQSPSHAYDSTGTYTATLTVTDAAGNSDTATRTVTVQSSSDTTAPTANAGSNRTVSVGSSVSFDGSASSDNTRITSYSWAFGDGTTASGVSPTHTYDSPGAYTTTLTVTDGAGNTATDSVVLTVADTTAPTADAGQNSTVDVGQSVTLDASQSGDDIGITDYSWTLGDGSTASEVSPTHTYSSAGTYTAQVTVSDGAGNTATDTVTITVTEATTGPTVTADGGSVQAGQSVTVPLNVGNAQAAELSGFPNTWTVDNRSDDGALTSSGDTYAGWVWRSDRATASVSVTLRVPSDARAGTYTLSATAEDQNGTTVSTTVDVSVARAGDTTTPTAAAGPDTTTAPGETVTFDGSASSDNVGITSYQWDFGDSTTASGVSPTHTYDRPGQYTTTLTVTDAAGNSDSDTLTVFVEQPADTQAPSADAGQEVTADVDQSVGFDASASRDNTGITSYQWTFGDGATATGASPTHTYGSAGTYTATLTVTDAAGNSATDSVTVTVTEPTTGQQSATVALTPSNVTTTPAGTSSVDVVVRNATAGIGEYNLNVAVPSVGGGVVDAADATAGGTVTVSTDLTGTTVTVDGTAGLTADNLTVARLALSGAVPRQSAIIVYQTRLATAGGEPYDTVGTTNATLTVVPQPPQLPNTQGPPTNLDDDGQYEDVDGDGQGGLFDALTYYNNRQSDAIQGSPALFDFDDDGRAGTLFDALALYNELLG